jgi:adenylate cyclase class 2
VVEIEVKVRVADLKAFRERLLALGAKVWKERYHEENTLYDHRDGRLRAGREALRLRRAGRKVFLTYKGAPQKSRKFKIRTEYETEVRNGRDFVRILQALDFVPVVGYEKHRTVLRKGTLKICLDETDAGPFVEFEGEREKIARMAEALGLPKAAWIKKDYPALLAEAKAAAGKV